MKPVAAICLISIAVAFSGCDKSQDQAMSDPESELEDLTIETDEGTVIGHTTEVEEFPQKVVAVNAAESRQFAEWATEAES